MTYLEILSWARKGLNAEKLQFEKMQAIASENGRCDLVVCIQNNIIDIEAKSATFDEIEALHNRK